MCVNTWFNYLVSLFVAAHALVYLATPLTNLSQSVFQSWKGTSAVLGAALSSVALRSLTTWLWIVAGVGLLATAGAIVFASFVPGIWRPLAAGGALAGVASFVVVWDGQGSQFLSQGGIGFVISLAILAAALMFPRAFT